MKLGAPPLSDNRSRESKKAVPILIFLVSFAILSVCLPPWDLVTRGEAREGLVIQAMAQQANFILPLRNGTTIPSKPPLFHWAAYGLVQLGQAAPLSLLGHLPQEYLIRLPSAFAAASLVTLFACFCLPLLGTKKTLLGTVFLFSTFDLLRTGSVARVDMMFAFSLCGSLYALYQVVVDFVSEGRKNYLSLTLASLFIVCAVLAKGPAGLVFPWVVAGLTMLAFVPLRRIPWSFAIISLVASSCLSGIWYWQAYKLGGQGFVEVQLLRENVARVVGMENYDTGHEASPFLSFPMFLIGLLPVSLGFPLILGNLKKRLESFRFQQGTSNREVVAGVFSLIWCLFFPTFFSLVASQRNVYLIPAFPAFVFLLLLTLPDADAGNTSTSRSARISRNLILSFSGCTLLVLMLFAVALLFPLYRLIPMKPHDLALADAIAQAARQTPVLLLPFLGAVYCCIRGFGSAKVFQFQNSLLLLCQTAVLLNLFIRLGPLPTIAEATTPRPFMQTATRIAQERGCQAYQFHDDYYAANFYFYGNLPRLNQDTPTPTTKSCLLFRGKQLAEIQQRFPDLQILLKSDTQNVYGRDFFVFAELPKYEYNPQL